MKNSFPYGAVNKLIEFYSHGNCLLYTVQMTPRWRCYIACNLYYFANFNVTNADVEESAEEGEWHLYWIVPKPELNPAYNFDSFRLHRDGLLERAVIQIRFGDIISSYNSALPARRRVDILPHLKDVRSIVNHCLNVGLMKCN